jgi:hypothetical protein
MATNFKSTWLWKKCFLDSRNAETRELIQNLEHAFDSIRERAAVLVGEIPILLPNYTVHDITHLDALWDVAGQITGKELQINPVEGFVLGCAFLLHDSAMTMAAYPDGWREIQNSKEWKKIIFKLTSQGIVENGEIDKTAIEIFIREQHAIRAETLPFITWKGEDGPRALIENSDYRQRFGSIIGKIAGSHWWNYDKLEATFGGKNIPVPPPYPSEWSIDLLKLACILRTADAANIDERRAPGFLFALRRDEMSEFSRKHWIFQNKLTQPQRRGDSLIFASATSFERDEGMRLIVGGCFLIL